MSGKHETLPSAPLEELDSEKFYNLMQVYRRAPIDDQRDASAAFHNVKDFVRELIARASSETLPSGSGASELETLKDLIELAYNKATGYDGTQEAVYPTKTLRCALAIVTKLANRETTPKSAPTVDELKSCLGQFVEYFGAISDGEYAMNRRPAPLREYEQLMVDKGRELLGWNNDQRLTLTADPVIAEAAKMPDYYGANKRLADRIHEQNAHISELEAERIGHLTLIDSLSARRVDKNAECIGAMKVHVDGNCPHCDPAGYRIRQLELQIAEAVRLILDECRTGDVELVKWAEENRQ